MNPSHLTGKDRLTIDEIKSLTLGAADLREASYDTPSRWYRLTEGEAAELACNLLNFDKGFAPLVGLALSGWWNDALKWAGDGSRAPKLAIPAGYVWPSRAPLGWDKVNTSVLEEGATIGDSLSADERAVLKKSPSYVGSEAWLAERRTEPRKGGPRRGARIP